MNNKGFTLIELMATITVMGILMVVALPNITSTVDKGKSTSYINDAKKLVNLARYQFEGDMTRPRPATGECRKYKIADLDRSELQNGPYNGKYNESYSYVIVKYESSKYIYYVQLIENFTTSGTNYYRGVKFTSNENLYKENAKIQYVTSTLTNLDTLKGENNYNC